MPNKTNDTEGRIEITPTIRVLEHGKHGWAIWDDLSDDACPLYPTKEKAIEMAWDLAREYADGER